MRRSCVAAEPLITKFAQVDHVPEPQNEAVASMPFGQRAVEIFNPSCDPIDLADPDSQRRKQVESAVDDLRARGRDERGDTEPNVS